MDPSNSLTRWPVVPQTTLAITATAVATASLLLFAKAALWPRWDKVLANPLKAGAAGGRVSEEELKGMVYHPDSFPGARDVETPYGTIRVYEFGPEDGEKVLLVHGISTPCIVLSRLANGLAERGSRVMLFDLFGRGFSDGVGDLPHDARLYVTQILLVLASSPLPWTGNNAMRLIGYSLGGGIAVHFATSFPHLVSSLALIAPAGLIRSENFGTVSRFIFQSGVIPERILAYLTRIRLRQPIAAASRKPKAISPTTAPAEIAVAEAVDMNVAKGDAAAMPLEERILRYVSWMVVHHAGFVPAFMSSIRYAPLIDQHDSWRLLSRRDPGTTLVLLAEHDEIIDVDDYKRDGVPLTGGEDHTEWRVVPGTHDFVITHTDRVLRELDQWWGPKN
ncbi:hypothetical protein PT974_08579 [Cladobotryum mycophilum]|uniref:Serine aminopeptidase S33 domain-containing protein n=1 Tax=Cladobotryum mycophilum TaxID=491253 RepID=A0ABR0SDQ5_9HYPO